MLSIGKLDCIVEYLDELFQPKVFNKDKNKVYKFHSGTIGCPKTHNRDIRTYSNLSIMYIHNNEKLRTKPRLIKKKIKMFNLILNLKT